MLYADPIIGILVALVLAAGSWNVFGQSYNQLMDRELPDEDRARIRTVVMRHPEVRDMHDLRTRAAGTTTFIQLHVELDPTYSLMKSHGISDEVEAVLHAEFPNAEIIIHQDPGRLRNPGGVGEVLIFCPREQSEAGEVSQRRVSAGETKGAGSSTSPRRFARHQPLQPRVGRCGIIERPEKLRMLRIVELEQHPVEPRVDIAVARIWNGRSLLHVSTLAQHMGRMPTQERRRRRNSWRVRDIHFTHYTSSLPGLT